MSGQLQDLHFSIGPVQSWISLGRRQRDLWAGSFLLSVLAGRAMRAAGGDLQYPDVGRDALWAAITKGGGVPQYGTLVNRFHTRVKDGRDAGDKATKAVEAAWGKVQESVWGFLQNAPSVNSLFTSETEEIWNRQVAGYWEIHWAVGDGELLDRRKNLRGFCHAEEGGEKCTVCGERSALRGRDATRKGVRDFWQALGKSTRVGAHAALRTDGSERLCALCTVKRLCPIPGIASGALELAISKDAWSLPSLSTVCTLKWRTQVLEAAARDNAVAKTVADLSAALVGAGLHLTEGSTEYAKEARSRLCDGDRNRFDGFIRADGDLLFDSSRRAAVEDGLRNANSKARQAAADKGGTGPDLLPPDINQPVDAVAGSLAQAQGELAKALRKAAKPVGAPSPFYGMLGMDGDSLGRILGRAAKGELKRADGTAVGVKDISAKLAEFARQAPAIIKKHHGWVLYCGADDVLALLPVDEALPAAAELRKVYSDLVGSLDLQDEAGARVPLTISAGITYAYMSTPLQSIVRDQHDVLHTVAKDELGRDAFAVRVWKRGGPVLTWGKKWDLPPGHPEQRTWADEATWVAEKIGLDGQGLFSHKFLYRLREMLLDLQPLDEHGLPTSFANLEVLEQLARSEFNSTRGREGHNDGEGFHELQADLNRFVRLCHEPVGGGDVLWMEAALFARFLAQKGGD